MYGHVYCTLCETPLHVREEKEGDGVESMTKA